MSDREHPYKPSPHSGAGNCWCGHAERSAMHPEHKPMATWRDATRCTCSRPMGEHPLGGAVNLSDVYGLIRADAETKP